MSNKTEKETGRRRPVRGGGLESSSNSSAGTSRLTRLEKSSDVTPKKCSTNKTKNPEEPSVAAKKSTKVDVVENEPRNSGAKTASNNASRLRSSAEVPNKRPSSVAQKEAKGQQGTDRVAQGPSVRKRPDPPANKAAAKNATSDPQIKREKAQAESSAKKPSAKKQQPHPSGSNSKPPIKTTNSTPATNSSPASNSSKQKKPAIQKQVSTNKPSPKDQSPRGKQAKNKASTSGSKLNSSNNPEHYIEWKGFEEANNRLEECCRYCEKDIRVGPLQSNTENEYSGIPVVAILPCRHIFHIDCLSVGGQAEPRCFYCDRC